MLSSQDKENIYATTILSNMRQLSRKYYNCKNTCILPIQCTFNITPIFYTISGNYQKSSNDKYNTILIFTEDATTITYVPIYVYVTAALQSDPDNIIFTNNFLQQPGTYETPAGSNNLIIKSYFIDTVVFGLLQKIWRN